MQHHSTPQQQRQRQREWEAGSYAYTSANNNNNKYGPSYGTSPMAPYVDRSTVYTSGGVTTPQQRPSWMGVAHGRFSEIPMRRRRRRGDSLAKWTTRAVLASPLIVLVLWSIALVLHAGKASTMDAASTTSTALQQQEQSNRLGSTAALRKRRHSFTKRKPPPPHKTTSRVVQPARIAVQALPESLQKGKDGYFPVVDPLGKVQSQSQVVPIIAPLGSSKQENIPVVDPLGSKRNVIPIVAPLGNQQQEVFISEQAAPVNLSTRTRPKLEASQVDVNNLLATDSSQQQQQQVQVMAVQNGDSLGSTYGVMAAKKGASTQAENELAAATETENASGIEENAMAAAAQPPLTSSAPKIYYYDASALRKSGQLYVPAVVYDVNGTPIQLATLNDGHTEIYLEPPSMGSTVQQDGRSLGSTTSSNNTPKMQLGEVLLNADSMPQARDQMIIIATVATMALLVGALSARRMRSRHFLSSCIENESLEDELAYDTAYTTYDTFGANHWKGDLEKFDV